MEDASTIPAPSVCRLWGIGTARTMRPIWLLRELDLDFELKPVQTRTDTMQTPEFRALSERSKIPLFEEGELVIGESAGICLYLAERHRDRSALLPESGTSDRARHDELCWFTMTEIDALLYTIRRHDSLTEVYGAAPVAVEAARAYFLRSAGEMERRLADGRPHLLGEAFSVADLLLKTCLDWAAFACGIELPRSLADYSASISARPAYLNAMRLNFPPAALAAIRGDDSP